MRQGSSQLICKVTPDFVPISKTEGLRLESLGRIVIILLPAPKLKVKSPRDRPFEEEFHDRLLEIVRGYTIAAGNIRGFWKDKNGRALYGEHVLYRVACANDKQSGDLGRYLQEFARDLREDCLYFEEGADAFLIYAQPADSAA